MRELSTQRKRMETSTQTSALYSSHLPGGTRLLMACMAALAVGSSHAAEELDHRGLQSWPISLGTSGGNIDSVSESFCCSGTLGALLQDQEGFQYILGSAILARANFGQIGDEITQPGTRDYICVPSEFTVVANLAAFVPFKYHTSKKNVPLNEVSAAIALVHPGAVWSDGRILGIGPVNPLIAAPSVGLRVKKSGRNTGLTFGTIKAINVTVDADAAPVACAGSGPLKHRMVNQFKIGPDGFAVMTADSGALVVTDEPGLPRPVGIVWAHSPSVTLACRIDRALPLLSEHLGSALSFPPVSSSSAPSDASINRHMTVESDLETLAPGDPLRQRKIDRARAVQERHGEALFDVPEVVGHGVGLTEDGEPVLEVYLRTENARSRGRIPAALENVPTRILVTGPFTQTF